MDMRTTAVALLLAGSLLVPVVLGAEEPDRLTQIVEQQRELEQDLDTIEGITKRQRAAIRRQQQTVFALAAGKASLDELTIEQKVKLENALERINAELVNTSMARSEQERCDVERRVGSQREVAVCASEEERTRIREGARAWMEKPKICSGPGCG